MGLNSSLCEMNLQDNKIGDQGASYIGAGLKTNTTLKELDLGVNFLGNKGAIAIVNALKINKFPQSGTDTLDSREISIRAKKRDFSLISISWWSR